MSAQQISTSDVHRASTNRSLVQHSTFNTQHSRRVFLDLARGAAVTLMVVMHALNALLSDAYRHNDVWHIIDVVEGFVAPAFLFFSGATLWLALERRGDDVVHLGPRTRALLIRSVFIVLLGYWLHIPVLSLRQLVIIHRPDELHRLFTTDILHVISVMAIAVTLTAWAVRSIDRAKVIALIAALAIVVATPWLMSIEAWRSVPFALGSYLAPQPIAVFSLLPYGAYLLFGFVVAQWLITLSESPRGSLFMLLFGVGAMACAAAAQAVLNSAGAYGAFWEQTPQHVLFRLGGVLLLAGVASAGAHLPDRAIRPLAIAGQLSLSIYVLHLMAIYGSPVNIGMRYWMRGAFNGTLTPLETLSAATAIMVITAMAAYAWKRLRELSPTTATWCRRIWWTAFWALFLLIP